MTQIKLQKQSIESSLPGITPDVDENNIFFNRLTFSVKHIQVQKCIIGNLIKATVIIF